MKKQSVFRYLPISLACYHSRWKVPAEIGCGSTCDICISGSFVLFLACPQGESGFKELQNPRL